MNKRKAYTNIFFGLILIWIEFHYKFPNSIAIQIDLINDLVGAIIFLNAVSWLENNVDESFSNWKTVGYVFVVFGIVDFVNLNYFTDFSLIPNLIALISWILFIGKIVKIENENLQNIERFNWQKIEVIIFIGLGFLIFIAPKFLGFPVFRSMLEFLLFILIVNLIYSIPYFRIKSLLRQEKMNSEI